MKLSINENKSNVVFDPNLLRDILKEKEKKAAEETNPEQNKEAADKFAEEREQKDIQNRIEQVANRRIQEIVDIKSALKEIESFAQLKFIVKKAKAKLSPLGKRYIKVGDHEGILPVDALAAKVVELVKKNQDFDEVERKHGKAIIAPLNDIYMVCNLKVGRAKGLTKFLAKLRAIPYLILSCFSRSYSKIQWNWCYCEIETEFTSNPDTRGNYRVFDLYTKNQYKNVFNKDPEGKSIKLHGLDIPYFKKPVDN